MPGADTLRCSPNSPRTGRTSSQRAIVDELRQSDTRRRRSAGFPDTGHEVAEVFGVSPIPVRESLKTLTAEGLVAHQPNIGYAVARLTATELAELYIVRETLESAALSAAVANAPTRIELRSPPRTDCWKEPSQRTIRIPTTARADTFTSA